jgi:hypothetical protein
MDELNSKIIGALIPIKTRNRCQLVMLTLSIPEMWRVLALISLIGVV